MDATERARDAAPAGFRSGFVGLIGRPNVGKSTLLNRLVGRKVAIVSDKPQTTRNRLHGVLTRPEGQMVLVDTPGLHEPRHRLGEYMNRVAQTAMTEVDVIWFLRDATRPLHREDREVALRLARSLASHPVPVLEVLNKIDQLSPAQRAALVDRAGLEEVEIPGLRGTYRVSALQGEGVEELLAATFVLLPEGPQYYPADWITDHPEQFVAAELVREKLLHLTRDEVPHSVAVVIEEFRQRPDRPLIDIRAVIYVERESQKGIVIGKGGQMLRAVGQQARMELEALLGCQVNLQLWVKVKPDWRDKEGALQQFGYR